MRQWGEESPVCVSVYLLGCLVGAGCRRYLDVAVWGVLTKRRYFKSSYLYALAENRIRWSNDKLLDTRQVVTVEYTYLGILLASLNGFPVLSSRLARPDRNEADKLSGPDHQPGPCPARPLPRPFTLPMPLPPRSFPSLFRPPRAKP
jgi:hypothetical protein